jgi:hypothetical protein
LNRLLAILRGLVLQPKLVAAARGAVEGLLTLLIMIVTDSATSGEIREAYPVIAPFIVIALRFLEGVVDSIDPAKERRRVALAEEAFHTERQAAEGRTPAGPLLPGDVQ